MEELVLLIRDLEEGILINTVAHLEISLGTLFMAEIEEGGMIGGTEVVGDTDHPLHAEMHSAHLGLGVVMGSVVGLS